MQGASAAALWLHWGDTGLGSAQAYCVDVMWEGVQLQLGCAEAVQALGTRNVFIPMYLLDSRRMDKQPITGCTEDGRALGRHSALGGVAR